MSVKELKQRLNGFDDESPVLLEDITMCEVHELRSVSHDRMCEWIEQQKKPVCVLSIKDTRSTNP